MEKEILVVDDDESIRKTIKSILETVGYVVDTAKTGREGLEMCETKHYNLALLDIKLPDMEGTALLTQMHRLAPKMMKIMVTGYPSIGNTVDAINKGADAYVIKPVKPDVLLKVVEEKLKEQEEAEKMSEEKVAEWIENRVRKFAPDRL